MMQAEVSRACARLRNYWNMPPGPDLDRLIRAAETAKSVADLPGWVKRGLREMNDPSMTDAA